MIFGWVGILEDDIDGPPDRHVLPGFEDDEGYARFPGHVLDAACPCAPVVEISEAGIRIFVHRLPQ